MRKILILSILSVVACLGWLFNSCQSCKDNRVNDISDIPGIYEGKAEVFVPENLKKMVKPDSTGKSPIPDKPVACKLQIKENDNKELTIELVDFMPMQGLELTPSSCDVTQDGEAFGLSGEGKVAFGKTQLSYVHEGKITGSNIHLDGTVYIIPKLLGVKIVFDGEKI